MTSLEVEIRPEAGKGVARKLRAAGKTPGIVYGPGAEPMGVAVDPVALVDIFNQTKNRNTVVELTMGGDSVKCLVREVQRHPLSREILHVDFYRVSDDTKVEVVVPIVPVGKPKGATLGGRIRLIRRTMLARCLPNDIPEAFEIDVTPLDIGDMVSSSDLALPAGVELVLKQHIFVLTCYGKRKGGKADAGADLAGEGEGEAAEGGDAAEGEA